jgi:bifunctional non-homologous end joining protein LigD
MAFRAGDRIALYTRNGHDWADRYPLVAAALEALQVRSCLIDGKIVVTRPDDVACFDRLRSRQHDAMAFVYAFDLLELDGSGPAPRLRKATLASVIAEAGAGLRLNESFAHDGPLVFARACKFGLEGIVSKRKASHYRSGTSRDWLKSKNPASEAVHREAFEHWRR